MARSIHGRFTSQPDHCVTVLLTLSQNFAKHEWSDCGKDFSVALCGFALDTRQGLVANLNKAQAKREMLEQQLRLAEHPDVTVLHPNAAVSYSNKVAQIQAALTRGDVAALEAIKLIRGIVREIRITPAPDKMELEVRGDLAALLEQEQRANKRDFHGGCGGRISTYDLQLMSLIASPPLHAHWCAPKDRSGAQTSQLVTARIVRLSQLRAMLRRHIGENRRENKLLSIGGLAVADLRYQ